MTMKHRLVAASLLGLWYGVSAVGAPADPEADASIAATGPTTESSQTTGTGQAAPEPAAGGVEFTSDTDKVNYSLGYELGQDLARDSVDLAPEVLIEAVRDGIAGAEPLVKSSERRAALAAIKAKRAQENLAQSQAFLTANAAKEGVQSLPSGLQYKELRAGEGQVPTPTSRVTVHYRGTFLDGREFDSTYARNKPATLDIQKVLKGWREALQLMKEGAKWELYIPPDLGYGKSAGNKRIPPNSALIFEVELLSVDNAPVRSQGGLVPKAAADSAD